MKPKIVMVGNEKIIIYPEMAIPDRYIGEKPEPVKVVLPSDLRRA